MGKHQRKYDAEFKKNAVLLTQEKGRTVKDVADNLGVSADLSANGGEDHLASEKLPFLAMGYQL